MFRVQTSIYDESMRDAKQGENKLSPDLLRFFEDFGYAKLLRALLPIFKKHFDKKVSTSLLRSIYISHKYNGDRQLTNKAKKELADEMGITMPTLKKKLDEPRYLTIGEVEKLRRLGFIINV